MSGWGQIRSFGFVGLMSGLPESGHGWAIYEPLLVAVILTDKLRMHRPLRRRRAGLDSIVLPVRVFPVGSRGSTITWPPRGRRDGDPLVVSGQGVSVGGGGCTAPLSRSLRLVPDGFRPPPRSDRSRCPKPSATVATQSQRTPAARRAGAVEAGDRADQHVQGRAQVKPLLAYRPTPLQPSCNCVEIFPRVSVPPTREAREPRADWSGKSAERRSAQLPDARILCGEAPSLAPSIFRRLS